MSIHFYILSVLAAADICLALWMFARYIRTAAILYYAAFLLSLGCIAVISALTLTTWSDNHLLILDRLGYIFGAMTFTMLLFFSFYYPVSSKLVSGNTRLMWIIPLAFFVPFIFIPAFIPAVSRGASFLVEEHGPLYFIFPLYVVTLFIWSMYNLVRKLKTGLGINKSVRIFIYALLLTALIGVVNDVILRPIGKTPVPYLGDESSSLIFALTVGIILKK